MQDFASRLGKIEELDSDTSWFVVIAQIDDIKCVIKWRYPYSDISQSANHEMLQVQALKQDLSDKLGEVGVTLPTFLFATPLISCRYFENGEHIMTPASIRDQAEAADTIVRDYIAYQNANGNVLWNSVAPDAIHLFDRLPSSNNFVRQEDKKLMWFDPLLYHPPGLKPKMKG